MNYNYFKSTSYHCPQLFSGIPARIRYVVFCSHLGNAPRAHGSIHANAQATLAPPAQLSLAGSCALCTLRLTRQGLRLPCPFLLMASWRYCTT